MGWSASDTNELSFSDCRVPLDHLLGEEGRGYAQFLEVLDEGRIAVAALSVGLAQGCIDEMLGLHGPARSVRAQNRRIPGAAVQAGRHGGAGLTRPGSPGTTPPPAS